MSEQGSEAWKAERAGRWTASRFAGLIAADKKTGKPLKSRADAIWNCVVERMTGQPADSAGGFALQWGTEVEPAAREAFELETGKVVQQAGFMVHPQYSFAGASPDGLIGDDEGLELKSPYSSSVHLSRFIEGVPSEYLIQIHGCMWVTGRAWWDFVSYDPRQQEKFRILKIRVNRDEEFIRKLEAAVLDAELAAQELQARLERIAA